MVAMRRVWRFPARADRLAAMEGVETAAATEAQVRAIWEERWGGLIVSLYREFVAADVEGLVVASEGEEAALVTWHVDGDSAEIVSLDALIPGQGYGSTALAAAEDLLRARGVRRLWLTTTNDNAAAIAVYLRGGWRLVAVHLDHMDRVRARKPAVPLIGENGLALCDAWELEKRLR